MNFFNKILNTIKQILKIKPKEEPKVLNEVKNQNSDSHIFTTNLEKDFKKYKSLKHIKEKKTSYSIEDLKLLNKYVKADVSILSSLSSDVFMALSCLISNTIKIPNIKIEEPQNIYLTNSQKISIPLTLDIFKSIDDEMYQKALSIFSRQDEIPIIYNHAHPSYKTCRRSFNHHMSPAISLSKNSHKDIDKTFTIIEMNLSDSIEDIYDLAHEISHTFHQNPNIPLIDKSEEIGLLSEIPPFISEQFVQDYLLKEKIITPAYAIQRDLYSASNISRMSRIIRLRIILASLYLKNIPDNIRNNSTILQKNEYMPLTAKTLLDSGIINNENEIQILCQDYKNWDPIKNPINSNFINYVLAYTVVYPYINEKYKANPNKTISQIKKFTEYLKHGDSVKEALNILDISLTPEFISSLLEQKNKYIKKLLDDYSKDNSDTFR